MIDVVKIESPGCDHYEIRDSQSGTIIEVATEEQIAESISATATGSEVAEEAQALIQLGETIPQSEYQGPTEVNP